MNKRSAPVSALVFGISALTLLLLPACAAGDFSASAYGTPSVVTVKETVSLTINITNNDNITYQTLVIQVFIYPDSATPGVQLTPDKSVKNIGLSQNGSIQYDYKPLTADVYSITVKFFNGTNQTANYLYQMEVTNVFEAKPAPAPPKQELPVMLIAIVVVVVVVVIAAVAALLMMRKRKAAAEAQAADEAAVAAKAQEEPSRVQGKFPKDYYKFRREKLSKLKPTGMTRGGTTILGNIEHKEAEEELAAEAPVCKTCCPKCGIEMGTDWKNCKNCGAKSTIGRSNELLAKLESAGEDVSGLRNTLALAETERVAGNYDEAETYGHDVLDKARSSVKRVEDARKQAEAASEEESESYAEEVVATKEEAPQAEKGYAQKEEPAKAYVEGTIKAKGYAEPSTTTEGATCFKCGQGLKPEWKKCPYCGAIQEGICPGCGRTVKMKWNVCPQCRTDFKGQPPKPACPVCRAEMSDGAECASCKARALLDTTSRLVREVKAKGADVVESEALLGRGELALRLKNYDKAVGHFQHAEELAVKSRREFRIRRLNEKIEHARSLAKDSADLGADVGEALGIVEKASVALKEERFEEGITLADRAAAVAEAALDKVVDGKEKERKEKAKIQVSIRKPVIVGPAKIVVRCPHCQEPVEEGWPSCPACETPLK
jgi:tetratricopeptide (TPR) repeat protein